MARPNTGCPAHCLASGGASNGSKLSFRRSISSSGVPGPACGSTTTRYRRPCRANSTSPACDQSAQSLRPSERAASPSAFETACSSTYQGPSRCFMPKRRISIAQFPLALVQTVGSGNSIQISDPDLFSRGLPSCLSSHPSRIRRLERIGSSSPQPGRSPKSSMFRFLGRRKSSARSISPARWFKSMVRSFLNRPPPPQASPFGHRARAVRNGGRLTAVQVWCGARYFAAK